MRHVRKCATGRSGKRDGTYERDAPTLESDGTTLTARCDYPRGSAENPLSRAQIESKFRTYADGVLTPSAIAGTIDAVGGLGRKAICRTVAISRKRPVAGHTGASAFLPGVMLHQDGSRHCWIPAFERALDLIIALDDATGAIYSAFLVEEEGTFSSLRGLLEHRSPPPITIEVAISTTISAAFAGRVIFFHDFSNCFAAHL